MLCLILQTQRTNSIYTTKYHKLQTQCMFFARIKRNFLQKTYYLGRKDIRKSNTETKLVPIF